MPAAGEKTWDSRSVSVRRMMPSDAPQALVLLEESPEASLWSRPSLEESVTQGIGWVAEAKGAVAGFLIGRAAADEFEILNLAVGKKFRRNGMASRLIETCLETARAAGVAKIFLEVRASNLAGIELYAKMGFRRAGQRKKYYRDPIEDAVLLIFNHIGMAP
jgi:ribosomal-protein-alanine N-acetyltransferase